MRKPRGARTEATIPASLTSQVWGLLSADVFRFSGCKGQGFRAMSLFGIIGTKDAVVAVATNTFSLPEFMNFKLFGKTVLVVNVKFGLFVGPSTQQVSATFEGGIMCLLTPLLSLRLRGGGLYKPHLYEPAQNPSNGKRERMSIIHRGMSLKLFSLGCCLCLLMFVTRNSIKVQRSASFAICGQGFSGCLCLPDTASCQCAAGHF